MAKRKKQKFKRNALLEENKMHPYQRTIFEEIREYETKKKPTWH